MKRQKGLGRGLDALLGANDPPSHAASAADAPAGTGSGSAPADPARLPLHALAPGRYQPRTRMDEAALQELADSIRVHGLVQPIVVRPLDAGRYEIIAGERRYRAAQMIGLDEVPVLVKVVPDEQALQLALIENIQRENLNPLEEAQAVRRLIEEFDHTHERAAEAIGRSRSATSNLLRLLNLAAPVQTMLLAGDLEMGHARALLPLPAPEQIQLAQRVVDRRLSVRQTEALVAAAQATERSKPADRRETTRADQDVMRLQRHLSEHLATEVEIRQGARGRGALVIHFTDLDAFDGLLDRLGLREAAPQ